MSKNTNISELINYISVNGSGDIVMTGNLIMPGGAQAATQTYVTTAISNLVASSPATLDTLNELALALGSDPNFATTVATSIGTKQPQLNGTGFIKASGTTITYDNSTYALDSAVVKLTGTQTVGGTKTFTSQIITDIQVVSPAFKVQNSGNTSLYSMLLSYSSGVRIVGLPDKDGTIAMTSDIPTLSSLGGQPALSGTGFVKISGTTVSYDNSTYLTTDTGSSTYVPYTGATSDVNIGINIFKSNYILLEGDASAGGYIGFKQKSGAQGAGLGYSSIAAQGLNKFYFRAYQTGADVKYFNFDLSSITSLTDRTYTLPDASGTLALTSNLSSYLPLAGGTLTGPLNGTTAIFSGGGNTLVLKKGTGSPAIALAGTSEEATGLIEGVSGGGIKFYTSTGTLSSPSWSSKLLITPTEGIKFGANAVSIIGTEGANGYHYMYAGGTPKIYLEAAGVVAFLNTGGTFVGTTTKWNGENFGVQTSNSAGWSTIPSIMRLTNYISGGVTKITFTDSNIIDGWFGMVPVSGNSYFAMGFSGYTEQGFKVYQGGSVSINASSIGYANTKLQVNGNSSTDENNTTVFIQHSFGGSNGFGLAISRNASSAAALSLGADTSNNGIISANNTNLRLGKNTSGTFYEYLNINTNGNSVFSGNVLPVSDAVYTLGSPSFRWNHVYTTDLHLSNEGKQNIVDGTWGDWTLQEGENDIFMLNNRSGEKFKMKLEKV